MDIDFLEFLEFVQKSAGIPIYDEFLAELGRLNDKASEEIEITIPEKLVEEFFKSKLID